MYVVCELRRPPYWSLGAFSAAFTAVKGSYINLPSQRKLQSYFSSPKPEYGGLNCQFVSVAAGGAVPLLPNAPPLPGLGPSQWRGAP